MEIKINLLSEQVQYSILLLVTLASIFVNNSIFTFFAFLMIVPIFVYMKYNKTNIVKFAVFLFAVSCLLDISKKYYFADVFISFFYLLLLIFVLCLILDFILRKARWEIIFREEYAIILSSWFLNTLFLLCICMIPIALLLKLHKSYPLPLHVDEWFHIGIARTIINGSFKSGVDFWTGRVVAPSSFEYLWHQALAYYGKLIGDSLFMYLILAALMSVAAIFLTYWFAKRWGRWYGLVAALLVAVLPSNVTIGGMTMLLPMNLFFIFMPVCLKIAFDLNRKWYLLAAAILFVLWFSHPPSAAIISIIIGIYSLACFVSDRKKSFCLLATNIIPFLIALPNLLVSMQGEGYSIINNSYLIVNSLPSLIGVLPMLLFIVGVYFIVQHPKKEETSIVVSIVLLIFLIICFAKTGVTFLIPAQRVYLPVMALMSIIAAYGFKELIHINMHRNFKLLIFVFFILSVAISIHNNINTPYYYLITEQEYRDFLWIKENTPEDAVFLLEPTKARPFYPVTMRKVVSVLPFGPDSPLNNINREINSFFMDNCQDNSFLKKYHPDYVYYSGACNNTGLMPLGHNLYKVTPQ